MTKTAIVTGAGRGIGRAVTEHLARDGVNVVVVDVDATTGEKVAAVAAAKGVRARFLRTDLARPSEIQRTVDCVVAEFGQIDYLSNNAGVTRTQSFFDVTEEDWDFVNTINARGAFFCMQAVARHMVDNGAGSIVNTASIASLGYRETTSVAYSASKGAVLTMTQVAAHVLSASGVRVNAVLPGPVYSDFGVRETRSALGRAPLADEKLGKLYAGLDERVPLGKANDADGPPTPVCSGAH